MVSVWPKRVKTQFASLALRLVLFLLQDTSFRSPSMRERQNFETVPLDFFLSLSLSTTLFFPFSCPVLFFFRWAFTTLASFRWENVSEKRHWKMALDLYRNFWVKLNFFFFCVYLKCLNKTCSFGFMV